MSVNAYLKPEIAQMGDFIPLRRHPNGGTIINGASFKGINVTDDKGNYFVSLGDQDLVPPQFEGFVTRFTVRSWAPYTSVSTRRETGIYRNKSAKAEVSMDRAPNARDGYNIVVSAEKLDDAHELVHQIKVGSIRPTESYEGSQNGMSRADLEAQLRELQTSDDVLRDDVDRLQRWYEEAEAKATKYRDNLIAFAHIVEAFKRVPWFLFDKKQVIAKMVVLFDFKEKDSRKS